MLSWHYIDAFQAPCEPSPNSSLSSSNSDDNDNNDNGNANDELVAPSDEEMEEEDFGGFEQGVALSSILCFTQQSLDLFGLLGLLIY